MAKETEWQAKIVKKIKAEGGYAHKRSHAYSGGIVDLLMIHRTFGVIFAEAKMLKPSNPEKFNLMMGFTEQQKQEGQWIRGAGGTAIGLAVVYFKPTDVRLVLTPLPPPRSVAHVTHQDVAQWGWKWQKTGGNMIEWIADNYRRAQYASATM